MVNKSANEAGVIKEIPLEIISDDIICRAVAETDKAMEYGLLMEAGVIFPPIDVYEKGDGTYVIGDGRTRFLGADLAKRKTITCRVHPKAHDRDILISAFLSNCGSGVPMYPADARHTIMRLIQLKTPHKKIIEQFPYPKSITQRYYLEAWRNNIHKRCANALQEQSKNPKLTLEDLARLFEVNLKDLQNYTSKFSDKSRKAHKNHLRTVIRAKYKNITGFTAGTLKSTMQKYQDGEFSAEYTRDILSEFIECAGRLQKNLVNWQNRFAKVDGPRVDNDPAYSVTKEDNGIVITPIAAKGNQI